MPVFKFLVRINLLFGILAPFLALGAVAYAVEGICRSGFRRSWSLLVALLVVS